MIKKTLKAFAFFAFLQLIVFSCCNNTFNAYYESVNFVAVDTNDFDTTTVNPEDLELNLDFLYDYIQISQLNEFKQLSNSAYATTCDDEYFFRDTVQTVLITSNETIFNVNAGEPLNDFLLFINPDTLDQENIDGMITFLNNQNGYSGSLLSLIFTENIASDTTLSLSITIELDRNRILESTTDLITIE